MNIIWQKADGGVAVTSILNGDDPAVHAGKLQQQGDVPADWVVAATNYAGHFPAGRQEDWVWDGSSIVAVAAAPTLADFQKAHDGHLDAMARTRKYDNIHTAALRAGYAGPYHDEGVAFAQWMDACNAFGYQVLAEVQAGSRPVPATTAAYLALLPVLVLP